MYCRNCGKEIDEQAAICVSCGYKNGDGNKFCFHCGKEVNPGAEICLSCGFSQKKKDESKGEGGLGTKSKLTAGLLGIFLGGLGIHNFYLGFTGKGVGKILTSLCSLGIIGGIWGLIEGILILCGKMDKDAQGKKLKN